MSSPSIAVARPDELPIVLEILDDAASWLNSRGIDQWPRSFTTDATWRTDRIRAYIDHGATYLVREDNGVAVATFTLTRGADPQFAHGWPDGPDSGAYLFRMAVRRSASGRDIGTAILQWAANEAARWGRRWLRVDVHRYNQKLQSYYEKRGFIKVAEVTAPDLSSPGRIRGSGMLMQRPIPEGKLTVEAEWDPEGTAAAWLEAADVVLQMRSENPPVADDAWNVALEQAARALSRHASEIKQANGMYYRSLVGTDNHDGETAEVS